MKLESLATVLLLGSSSLMAMGAKQAPFVDTPYTVLSVNITYGDCTVDIKGGGGIVYHMQGWVSECRVILSGETLKGHFNSDFFYFDRGYKDKKGREEYTRPYTLVGTSQ